MIIWLNGAFGAGKTATAAELLPMVANARLFDPETVGYLLRHHLADQPSADFQDWPAWRSLVVATAAELTQTGQQLIALQSVLHQPYWQEISDGLGTHHIEVFHVLLDAEESVLRKRISASGEAVNWRLEHLADYRDARSWLTKAADLSVDTGAASPADVARQVAEALPAVAPRTNTATGGVFRGTKLFDLAQLSDGG